MITENPQDELIFDFLEGNLSAEEEEAFRILKDESELFSREVRLWQNTYVEESLPVIEALEKKLLIHPGSDTGSFTSRIYVALLILFAFMIIPADRINEFTPDVLEPIKLNVAPVFAPEVLSNNTKEVESKMRKVETVRETTDDQNEIIDAVSLSELKVNALVTLEKHALQNIIVKQATIVKPVSVVARKKWTAREKRLLRQKRWQDNNLRQANEFQKGRVPYVVPLNSKNF